MKRRIFSLTLQLMLAMLCRSASVTYTPDNTSIFPNPERGFYLHTEKHVSKSSATALSATTLDSHRSDDKGSLVLIVYYLDNFLSTSQLPSEILSGFDKDMQTLRSHGMKCILRFAYVQGTYGTGSSESGKDAPLSIALSHMGQYKSHLAANSDVIYVVQAGIVGAWGEWYYSDNFGNQTSHMNASRKSLLDSLLKVVPANRYIQLRTPLFKTEYVGDTKALTSAEAYGNTPKARIGHHNDAFLYGPDNQGTYNDTSKQKPYLAQETLYVPMGGECDVYDESLAAVYCTREKTVSDMSRLHWTYINKGYAEATTNMWRNNGTFDELNRQMGYRFQLVSATLPESGQAGGKVSVNLKIRNTGYAPLYNERYAYIVFRSGSKSYSVRLASDPRSWLPNGVVTTINEQLPLPATMAEGTYQMYLYLPDISSPIASDARYAIRFANSGVWDSSTGMNALNASLTISGSVVPPAGEAVVLPAILNKANVADYCDEMTWYNTDYFDFGPEDNSNLDRWAEWSVELRYPGKYIISDMATGPDEGPGHQWQLQLLNGTNVVATYTTEQTWKQGVSVYDAKWDLTDVPAGIYSLRVTNVFEWAQPKLQSLTLDYEGVLPDGLVEVKSQKSKVESQKFIRNGILYIEKNSRVYNILGQEVR